MGIGCGCLMVIVAGMAAVLLGLALLSLPAARAYRKAQERQKSQPAATQVDHTRSAKSDK
jgi:hypothetical protein